VQVALDPPALALGAVDRRDPAVLEPGDRLAEFDLAAWAEESAEQNDLEATDEQGCPWGDHDQTEHPDRAERECRGSWPDLAQPQLGRAAGECSGVHRQERERERTGPEVHHDDALCHTDGQHREVIADLAPARPRLGSLPQPGEPIRRGQGGDRVDEVDPEEGAGSESFEVGHDPRRHERQPDDREGERHGDQERHAGDEQRERHGEQDRPDR
jgi:hypothetical protein